MFDDWNSQPCEIWQNIVPMQVISSEIRAQGTVSAAVSGSLPGLFSSVSAPPHGIWGSVLLVDSSFALHLRGLNFPPFSPSEHAGEHVLHFTEEIIEGS